MTVSTLDRALAEAVQDELADAGKPTDPESIAAFMAHRDLLNDAFWGAWDAAVAEIRYAYCNR